MAEQKTAYAENELTLQQRRDFMKLPLNERRRRMAEQADRLVKYYESNDMSEERQHWQGGDIVEC